MKNRNRKWKSILINTLHKIQETLMGGLHACPESAFFKQNVAPRDRLALALRSFNSHAGEKRAKKQYWINGLITHMEIERLRNSDMEEVHGHTIAHKRMRPEKRLEGHDQARVGYSAKSWICAKIWQDILLGGGIWSLSDSSCIVSFLIAFNHT